MRDSEDTRRYKEFYGIDNNDYAFCDLIIDVNEKTPEEIPGILESRQRERAGFLVPAKGLILWDVQY